MVNIASEEDFSQVLEVLESEVEALEGIFMDENVIKEGI